MFVLFLLLPFTVILPTLYNSMIAVFIFCCYDKKELCSGINNLEQMINEIQNITSDYVKRIKDAIRKFRDIRRGDIIYEIQRNSK